MQRFPSLCVKTQKRGGRMDTSLLENDLILLVLEPQHGISTTASVAATIVGLPRIPRAIFSI